MKFNIEDFISSVPVLRLFAKNLALNAGIAFVIQDFLIPLYSNYIFTIVTTLLLFSIVTLVYWFILFKEKNKNFAHFSFQLFAVCVIFAVMIGALSSVSKALSNDDRGILASNVDFVADLQDNTNIYDENIVSLGRDISRVSNQFSELQSDLSSLSDQIASQISDDGQDFDNDEFLDKISVLLDERTIDEDDNQNDTIEIVQLRKNLDIATELLKQVTLANVNLQKKGISENSAQNLLSSDSILFYISELKSDINDLRNFSLQLLANSALSDTRMELKTLKDDTKNELESLKKFTSLEVNEIKNLVNEILEMDKSSSNSSMDKDLSNEIKNLYEVIENKNFSSNSDNFDDEYLQEIVDTYESLAEKIDNNPLKEDIELIKREIANISSINNDKSSGTPVVTSSSTSTGNNSGISELKYYIVELMKDQNEIRQIVKELRDILEEESDE
tara:strand:+ start:5016 stop:6356 length:1341 start_codon:yes stop_codon:yes gene_type:complete